MNAALAIARALLQAGAKVNKRSQFLGKTPLHEAVCFKSAQMVQLLLASGAKHSARDKCGRTPLVVCATNHVNAPFGDSLEIAKLLLEAGAKVNRKIFSP
jgi:ankyrin repeat protein